MENNQSNLKNIKSKYILKQIIDNLQDKISLQLFKYSKEFQSRLELSLENYKEYCKVEVEIFPKNFSHINKYFNPPNPDKTYFYQVFVNDEKEKRKSDFSDLKYVKDPIKKIKIVLLYKFKDFNGLFNECKDIEKINFIKFKRRNITDMKNMFYNCTSLKEINFTHFNSEKVTNLRCMFWLCSSLTEINFTNFNTSNAVNMNGLFYGCSSLNQLNLANFNTMNALNMSYMFCKCSSLKELDLSNFDAIKDPIL